MMLVHGRRQVLEAILDVYDDVTRALEAAGDSETTPDPSGVCQSLKAGFELVHRKFSEALKRFDVAPIEAVGKPFDEREHEAVMQQPAAGVPPGTVVAEVRKGYRMGDQILRHAQVVVASG
jgi:molecular chaperone GrpE